MGGFCLVMDRKFCLVMELAQGGSATVTFSPACPYPCPPTKNNMRFVGISIPETWNSCTAHFACHKTNKKTDDLTWPYDLMTLNV